MRSLYLVIAFFILVLDQVTKWVILVRLSPDAMLTVIPGLFNLVRVENHGIAFGFLAGLSSNLAFGLIILISAAALAVVSYLLWKTDPAAQISAIGLALILGGAAGNLVDRIFRGSVVDFLDFYIRGYHWPAFNVADSAIVIGAGILVLDLFRVKPAKIGAERVSSEARHSGEAPFGN